MAEAAVISVADRLDRGTVAHVLDDLDTVLHRRPEHVILDLARVETFDSAGMGAVVEGMRRARSRGTEVRLRGLSQAMLDFFSLVSVERLTAPAPARVRRDPVSRLGAAFEPMLEAVSNVLRTTGEVGAALCVAPWRGKGLRLDRTILELDAAAIGALPIIALIGFLLGLILAMQAYVQLRIWGAELYIADMVGVSVTTEIGPLMTAIVLAARSGSANAAQLGAMVVSEEIDALRQMGLHPVRYLVVPKVLALASGVVMLCLVFDLIAICGGALFAFLAAGIEPNVFREQLQQALKLPDFLIATAKSLAFGTCIGIVGCALGLRVAGGSEGVGRATTNAVVLSVFLIICTDTVFVAAQRLLWP